MNELDLAAVICRHQHPAEWGARQSRVQPCNTCRELTDTVVAYLLKDYIPRHIQGAEVAP